MEPGTHPGEQEKIKCELKWGMVVQLIFNVNTEGQKKKGTMEYCGAMNRDLI